MVSIRKYLDMAGARTTQAPAAVIEAEPSSCSSDAMLRDLCDQILGHVLAHVRLTESSDAKVNLEQARAALMGDTVDRETAESIAAAAWGALERRRCEDKDLADRIASETSQIVGVLNEALLTLTGGSERMAARFKRIQESLERTSRVRDVDGLRASLADAIKSVQNESEREQEQAARDLAGFEAQVVSVRRKLSDNPTRQLRGRADAIVLIRESLNYLQPGSRLWAAGFRVGNAGALLQRYGREAMDDLFFQMARSVVSGVCASATCWRWSQGCVVGVFDSGDDIQTLQSRSVELMRAPLVHRMSLGSRTALLKVGVSQLIVQLTPDSLQNMIGELDGFSGLEAAGCG
jgi:hypothetical protein